MKVGMISLGCPKNQVSAEQMLYLLREAGHEIVTDELEAAIDRGTLAALCGDRSGVPGLARPRRQEILACLNRCRGLRIQ